MHEFTYVRDLCVWWIFNILIATSNQNEIFEKIDIQYVYAAEVVINQHIDCLHVHTLFGEF